MPRKDGQMTYKEQRIAEVMAETGNRKFAAFVTNTPYGSGQVDKIVNKPAVQEEIRRQQVAKLFQEALPAAVTCLVSIMTDAKASAGARVQASKVVLDRTLGDKDEGQRKEPHEMSAEEIAKAIDELERVAFERAKSVDSAQEVRKSDDIFQ